VPNTPSYQTGIDAIAVEFAEIRRTIKTLSNRSGSRSLADANGVTVFALDSVAGLALPYAHIPMYPTFLPSNFASGVPQASAQIPNAQLAAEHTLWQGRIGEVLNPAVYVEGIWGDASVGDLAVYTFQVKVGSPLVSIGTWNVTGAALNGKHVFDLHSYVGVSSLDIVITASQVSAGVSTNASVQLLGLSLGPTPPSFG
jgi:hypothetical protein